MFRRQRFLSLGVQLNLGISLVFLIVGVAAVWYVQSTLREYALVEAESKARILLDHNLAIHTYFTHDLKPPLFELIDSVPVSDDYFEPSWMSSTYAVRQIQVYFGTLNPGQYYYKEGAIDARSPANEADALERAFLEELNDNPDLIDRSLVRKYDGKPYYVTIRRGETLEQACLRCHSTPDNAPGDLVDYYGPDRSFNREEGEVISAISIRIPLSEAYTYANRLSLNLSAILLVLLLGLFAAQLLAYRRVVFVPLNAIRDKAIMIATSGQSLGEQIPVPSGKELQEVAVAFNTMSVKLREERDLLEQRVTERTAELGRLNEELERDIARREAAENALRESEQRYRSLFDHALNGVALHQIVTDEENNPVDYIFLEVNQSFERLTGLRAKDILNRRVSEVLSGIDESDLIRQYGKVALEGIPIQFERFFEPLGRHFSIAAFSPRPGQFAAVFDDITERRQAEAHQLELALEHERVLMLKQFIGDVSHDLMTSLAIIQTSMSLLEKSDQKRETRIHNVETQVDRVRGIIQDMLTMSRLDAPVADEFDFHKQKLNPMIDRVIAEHQPFAVHKNQTLRFAPGGDVPEAITFDEDMLARALGAVVDNALRYSPEEGTIVVSTGTTEDSVLIRVRDSGSGISAADLPRIFERFYRGAAHRPTDGGAGLGLSIAQKIIQAHDGTIEVERTGDTGTVICITLPLKPSE